MDALVLLLEALEVVYWAAYETYEKLSGSDEECRDQDTEVDATDY